MKLVIFLFLILSIGRVVGQYYQVPYYQPYPTGNYLSPTAIPPGYYLVPIYRPGWRCVKCNNIRVQVAGVNPEYMSSPGGYMSTPGGYMSTPSASYIPPPAPPMMVESNPIEYPMYKPVAPPPSFGVPYSKSKSIKH